MTTCSFSSWPHGGAWRWVAGATLALGSACAGAQIAQLPTLTHRVQTGDTLERLALRYLGDASQWQALQQHNGGINPYRLPPGQLLEIPLNLLRAATASVDYVQGSASLRRSPDAVDGSNAAHTTPVERGQLLHEGDALVLDPDAFVTVRLADGSTVRVQAGSQLNLTQLRRRGRAGSLQSVIELQQGGLEIAVPGRPDATRQLQIHTPVAATSVRGTRFDVYASAQGSSTAVERGRVALQGQADTQATALTAGLGAAVSAAGQAGAATALLPAIDTAQLPAVLEDAQWLQLPLPALAGASAYQVQVSHDAQGQQVLRNGRFDTTQGTPQARFAALPDGRYWVRVRAQDAQGISGHAATAPLRIKAHPVAPLATAPAPDAVAAQGQAQLECTPVAEASAYVIQVVPLLGEGVEGADFTQTSAQAVDSATCQLDIAHLPVGQYAWRSASVRWVDGQRDQGPFAPASRFTLAVPPATPTALDSQTVQGTTTIFWQGEPGQRYRLQALAAPDAQPALDQWLEQPQWTAAGLPAGPWLVRIQVQDGNGLLSSFSPPRQVTILPLVVDGLGQPIGTGTGLGLEQRY